MYRPSQTQCTTQQLRQLARDSGNSTAFQGILVEDIRFLPPQLQLNASIELKHISYPLRLRG